MADIKQMCEISSTVASLEKHVTAEMWLMVTTVRKSATLKRCSKLAKI